MIATAEPADTADALIIIGRCVACKRAFRCELPPGSPVWGSAKLTLVKGGVTPPWCDCRTTQRCPEFGNGLPECLDWDCSGHTLTEVKFSRLKVTYKPEAICGPGNCWGAISSRCTCSCRGKNHGGMWAVTR